MTFFQTISSFNKSKHFSNLHPKTSSLMIKFPFISLSPDTALDIIKQCYDVEQRGYENADEAVSMENLRLRAEKASDYFAVVYDSDVESLISNGSEAKRAKNEGNGANVSSKVVAMINATRTNEISIDHHVMSSHNPSGSKLCIHTVVTDTTIRSHGIGKKMLLEYVEHIIKIGKQDRIDEILLLAKSEMISFYISCGFSLYSQSHVSHGSDIWYEMGIALPHAFPICCADAFVSSTFKGNPAAVCIVPNVPSYGASKSSNATYGTLTDEKMKDIALEMNLSETAFILDEKGSGACSALFGSGEHEDNLLLFSRILKCVEVGVVDLGSIEEIADLANKSIHVSSNSGSSTAISIIQRLNPSLISSIGEKAIIDILALSKVIGLCTPGRYERWGLSLLKMDIKVLAEMEKGQLLEALSTIKVDQILPGLLATSISVYSKKNIKPDYFKDEASLLQSINGHLQANNKSQIKIGEEILIADGFLNDRVVIAFSRLLRLTDKETSLLWSLCGIESIKGYENFNQHGWKCIQYDASNPLYHILSPSLLAEYARLHGDDIIIDFSVVLRTIDTHCTLPAVTEGFQIGPVNNAKGTNMGSYKVLSFSALMGLNKFSTMRLWCEHLIDVLKHPHEVTKHQNIRAFRNSGWYAVNLPYFNEFQLKDPLLQTINRWRCLSVTTLELLKRDTNYVASYPTYRIRWFTPTVEVDLCGHATLGSAASLIRYFKQPTHQTPMSLAFKTNNKGTLIANPCCTDSDDKACNGNKFAIELNFPEDDPKEISTIKAEDVSKMLGNIPKEMITYIGHGVFDTIVEISNGGDGTTSILRDLQPNLQLIKDLLPKSTRGIIVTCKGESNSSVDFASRFFGPGAGIDEDPVTGSAHCTLCVYWSKKLGKGDEAMKAEQLSKRGGRLQVQWVKDKKRVKIQGEVHVSWKGEFDLQFN